MLPPDVKPAWNDCNIEAQAEIIGFNQLREHEEHELMVQSIKANRGI